MSLGPITVLGPTGSLMGLIDATGILSKELYGLARGVRAARKDIRKFARKLSMFSWSSNEACACLLWHYTHDNGLDTISNSKKKRFLKRAEESAREILEEIENIAPRIMSMEPSGIELGLISKIKWYQRKSEVRNLTFEMSALQTSLTLLMTTVTYEMQIRSRADPEALSITMAQITNFIEGAEVIATKFKKLKGTQPTAEKTFRRVNTLLVNVVRVADNQLDVAEAYRNNTELFEPGSWRRKKVLYPNSQYDMRKGLTLSRTKTRKQEVRPGFPPPPPPTTKLSMPAWPLMPPHGTISNNVPPAQQRKDKERQTDNEPPEASSSRGPQKHSRSNGLDIQNAGNNVGSENDRKSQPPGTRPFHPSAMTHFIAPRASDHYEEVNGYISKRIGRNTESSSRTARLYPTFIVNAMSRDLAEQLGLTVTVLSGGDFVGTSTHVGSPPAVVNHAVGEVRFVWDTATHILRVTCVVFEHEITPGVPFLLGKPYVQQVETAEGFTRD